MIKSPQKFIAFIALGSNLGDRAANITRAIALLSALPGCRVEKASSVYETEAVHMPVGTPSFFSSIAAPRIARVCMAVISG